MLQLRAQSQQEHAQVGELKSAIFCEHQAKTAATAVCSTQSLQQEQRQHKRKGKERDREEE